MFMYPGLDGSAPMIYKSIFASLSSLAQSNDSSNQNNNYFSGRRESPSKKDMKTKDFFRGQNERVIFTFQCGVSKHTVST